MLNKYFNQVENNKEVHDWINTTLNAWLKKNPENQGEIEHILDFLQSDKAPNRLRKMSYAQAKEGAAKWIKALAKKGNKIDDSTQIKIVKKWKDGFTLVKLVGKDSFIKEGSLMGHCVGTYHGKKESEVYSLRDEKNLPHCTIEIIGNRKQMNQIKGKGNGSIHPKYIKKVISILKYFNLEVKTYEMRNLGYVDLTEFELDLLKESGLKRTLFKYKKVTYLFNGC